jgi:hypothetical protein
MVKLMDSGSTTYRVHWIEGHALVVAVIVDGKITPVHTQAF